jgi:DHA1 family bicyclomycin/chloramphenicol resistance-like MFS transporter
MTEGRSGAPVPLVVPLTLMIVSAVSILSTDMYTPSLPHLSDVFATTPETVKLTMSLNVLGFAVALLVFGPLSDRFGRRPVLLGGLVGFIVCTLGCAAAQSIGALIAARTLQGVMASVEAVIALAVIRDLYDEAGSVRILAVYGMVIALAPAAGPVIGGYVHVGFGWRANFALLAVFGLAVTTMVWRCLPESSAPDCTALRPGRVVGDYLRLFANRRYFASAVVCGASLGGIYAFVTAAPFVFIDRLGVATQHFGFYQAAIVAAYFLGSLAANRLATRFAIAPILRAGLWISAAGGAASIAVLALGLESPVAITAAMALFAFGLGPVFATAPVWSLHAARASTGVAAALLSAVEMGGGAIGAFAVGIFHDGTAWPMAITVAAGSVVAMVAYKLAATAGPAPRSGEMAT